MESGTQKREYECSVGFVWFVIRRRTYLEMSSSICRLLDHVCSLIRSDWRMLRSASDAISRHQQRAV